MEILQGSTRLHALCCPQLHEELPPLSLALFGISHQSGTSSFTAPVMWLEEYPHSNPTAPTLHPHDHRTPHFPSSCLSNSTQLSKHQGSVSPSSDWGCPNFFRWLHLYHGYHQVTFCCLLRQVVSYFAACCQGNCWNWRTASTSSLKNGEHCY